MSRQAKVIITSTNNAGAGIKSAVKDLVSLESNATRIAQGIQNALSATAVVALGKKMVDFGIDSVKAFGDVERATAQLRTALGGSSQALSRMNGLIEDLSSKSLASKGDIRDLVADLASLGHSEDDINRIATAAVNLANVTGQGLKEAMKQVNSTFSGSTDELGKLIPEIKGLTKEQLAAGGAADVITQKFGNLSEAMAGGVTQNMKNLREEWGDFTEDLGELLAPALNDALRMLSEALNKMGTAIRKFGGKETVEDQIQSLTSAIAQQRAQISLYEAEIQRLSSRGVTGVAIQNIRDEIAAAKGEIAKFESAISGLKRSGASPSTQYIPAETVSPSAPARPAGLPTPEELSETEAGISAVTAAWAKMGNMIDYALEGEIAMVEVAGVFEQGWTSALDRILAGLKDWATFIEDSVVTLFGALQDGLMAIGQALYNGESTWSAFGSIAVQALSQILAAIGAQLAALSVLYAILLQWGKAALAAAGAAAAFVAAGVASAWAADLAGSGGGGSGSPSPDTSPGSSPGRGAAYTGSQPITFNFYNNGNVVGSNGLEELAMLIDSIIKRNERYA